MTFNPGIHDRARTGRQIRSERRRSILNPRYHAQRKSDPGASGAVDRKIAQKLTLKALKITMLIPITTSANRALVGSLRKSFTCFYDDSGSIGRRYARQDEIGTPLCITIDHETLKNDTVTLRNRDSTKQVRVNVGELKTRIEMFLEEN